MSNDAPRGMTGTHSLLQLGRRSAWATFAMFVVYALVLFLGDVIEGIPKEPYLTIAEILTMASAPVLVLLMAVIHRCAPPGGKVFSLTAFGWMLLTAGFTTAVHFVELTVARRIPIGERAGYAWLFGWQWPSMLYAMELAAWHLFFGLSLVFAASAFQGHGRERIVRRGLRVSGLLCIIGLVGPATGVLNWRMIGVFGYGVVFPLVCLSIASVFRHARPTDAVVPESEPA